MQEAVAAFGALVWGRSAASSAAHRRAPLADDTIGHADLAGVPLLVLANKCEDEVPDLPQRVRDALLVSQGGGDAPQGAMGVADLKRMLRGSAAKRGDRDCTVHAASAVTG